MDAFFASLEERSTPKFKGLPIAVGSDPKNGTGRGVVSTANYKAREYGIHSALPISQAWQLSQEAKKQGKPEVVFLPVDFQLYERASRNIYKIISKFSEQIEQASIDEFYFDLSFAKTFKKAEVICKKIKAEIKKQEKVTCSVGIGPNKLIAKISAGVKKPDGLFIVEEKDAERFLEPLPIRKIPGIGPKTAETLYGLNVKIVKDLKNFSEKELQKLFGKWGVELYFKARGQDNSEIEQEREAKSIGEQITFEKDTLSALYIGEQLSKMCDSVFNRFLQSGFDYFKTLVITVRFSGFETKTTAKSLKKDLSKDNLKDFQFEALKLVLPYLDKRKNPKLKPIRLIGVRIEKFDKITQKELF
jgi:DNA polymerase IV (DinB-like DNA polymerase)